MTLAPGSCVGVYEVTEQIGAGGMGEVYRATDSNLKRSVAIKVLPASVAGDADRLARFQREAEVLAALNHPNIAAIYGLEKTPDVTALVMELVEGDDLSQRIAQGPMPLDEALSIARQIADALAAAHGQGIIHRDLKPANIKLRADGTVKVLDFGLAKAVAPHGMPAWSRDGFIYFIRTFTTVANLDAAEIYRIDSRGNAPMEPVVRTIRRALFPLPMPGGGGLIFAANPHTAELRLWWSPLEGGPARQLTTAVGEYAEPRAFMDGRTLACTLYELRQSLTRIEVNPAAPTVSAITDGYHGDLDPVISSSGDRIIFSSSRDGNRHLWAAAMDGSGARPLTSGSALDDRPALSPDGQQVAFVSDRGGTRAIWVMSSDGGPPRKLVDASSTTGNLTWSRDGARIVYAAGSGNGQGLWLIPSGGGAAQRIATPFSAAEPAWSPTQDVIAYMSVRLGTGASFSTVAFVDPKGQPLFEHVPPAQGSNGFANGTMSWSPDGRRLAVVQQQANSAAQIWILEVKTGTYNKLVDFPEGPRIRGMTWTRDGRALVIGKHDWTSDIVVMDQQR